MAKSEDNKPAPAPAGRPGPTDEEKARLNAPPQQVEPHTREPLPMRGVDQAALAPAISPQDAARMDEIKSRGPQNEEEGEELKELQKRGEVPPGLTEESKRRLAELQSRAPLPPHDMATMKRLESVRGRSAEQQRQLDALYSRGPRNASEEQEMHFLQEAADRRAKYEHDQDEMLEKEAAGPFSVEQWKHLKAWVRHEMELRASGNPLHARVATHR